MYNRDTIVADILSLGKYAEVLKEPVCDLPKECGQITYDKDMYYCIKGIYSGMNDLYNGNND